MESPAAAPQTGPYWQYLTGALAFLLIQQLKDFSLFGEPPARLILGENHLSINLDVVNSAISPDQFGVLAQLPFYLAGQTGREWVVVSTHAIGNADLHHPVSLNIMVFPWE